MGMRIVRLSIIPFSFVLSTSVPAQHHIAACNDADFDALTSAGEQQFLDKDYQQCADTFACAYRQKPVHLLLYSIATCFDGANRYAEALDAYRAYLDGEENPKRNRYFVKQATRRIDEIPSQLSYLVFEVYPLPAEARIDGNEMTLTDARQRVVVDPGPHDIALQSESHEDHAAHISVQRGETKTVAIKLLKQKARLSLRCDEPSALVFIDNRLVGSCPLPELDIPEGRFHLKVVAAGSYPFEQTVLMSAGESLLVHVVLRKHRYTSGVDPTPLFRASLAVGGGVVAGIGVADIVLTLLARKAKSSAREKNNTVSQDEYESYMDARTRYENWMGSKGRIVGYALGSAMAVAGAGYLFYRKLSESKEKERADREAVMIDVYPGGIFLKF